MENRTILLKINNYKLEDKEKLTNQLNKVLDYLLFKNKIVVFDSKLFYARIGDDFLKNKFTLKIEYKYVTR